MIFLPSEVLRAAHHLKQGGIVAFPTETVYGLGASVFQPQAIEKIYYVKNRPRDNPLIVHISSLEELSLIVHEPPEDFYTLAHQFFPGPLTILLEKKQEVPPIVSAHSDLIGVRMPDHDLARQLIEAVGVPLVAPSANLSGKPSSTMAQHVIDDFGDLIAGVLDGGSCRVGIESTVITLTPQPTILRPGCITKEQIERVLRKAFIYADTQCDKPLAPGMKYRHYAPQAKVKLFYKESLLQSYIKASSKKFLLARKVTAQNLYHLFRHADRAGYEEILILCDLDMMDHCALMNRLQRAAEG